MRTYSDKGPLCRRRVLRLHLSFPSILVFQCALKTEPETTDIMKEELDDREKANTIKTDPDDNSSSGTSSLPSAQAEVEITEAVSTAWTKRSLICAYAG